MNKFPINDWLTIQTRKDLTYIKRRLEHESVSYAIFADLFIAVFSFVMDHILWPVADVDTGKLEQVVPLWYWICTAVFLVGVPALIFSCSYMKKRRYQADVKKVMPVDYLIDMFDNEICYNVMTADSMRDHLMDATTTLEDEIRKFYFIEASYYANKASSQLFYFKNQGQNAIQTATSFGGVSFSRFQNVCEIVFKIYLDLVRFVFDKEEYEGLFEDNKEYIFSFNDLIFHMASNVPELEAMKSWRVEFQSSGTSTS